MGFLSKGENKGAKNKKPPGFSAAAVVV